MLKKLLHIVLIGGVLFFCLTLFDTVFLLEVERYGFLVSFVLLLLSFSLIELFIHPILRLLFLPIRILTLGSVSFLLSTALVFAFTSFYPAFVIEGVMGYLILGGSFALLQRIGS